MQAEKRPFRTRDVDDLRFCARSTSNRAFDWRLECSQAARAPRSSPRRHNRSIFTRRSIWRHTPAGLRACGRASATSVLFFSLRSAALITPLRLFTSSPRRYRRRPLARLRHRTRARARFAGSTPTMTIIDVVPPFACGLISAASERFCRFTRLTIKNAAFLSTAANIDEKFCLFVAKTKRRSR